MPHTANAAPHSDGDTRPVPSPILAAALSAADLGYPVFALPPGGKEPAKGSRAKNDAALNPDTLRRMFASRDHNLGIAWPQGVLAIDLDVPKDDKKNPLPGAAEYADEHAGDYEARYPELRTAPRVRTRADGVVWVVRLPDSVGVASKVGAVELDGGGGIDLRGDGRTYTVAPPSTVSPGRYMWERDLVPVAQLPLASRELLDHLTEYLHSRNGEARDGDLTAGGDGELKTVKGHPVDWATGTLNGARRRLSETTENRNDACYFAALNLGRWVGGYQRAELPGLTREAAYAALLEAMQANGDHADDPRKAEGTINGGLDNGIRSAYVVTVTPHTPRLGAQNGRQETARGDESQDTELRVQAARSDPQPATADHVQPHRDLATFDRTDLGNAERLAHTYGHLMRYVGGLGWHTWTGTHWEYDNRGSLLRLAGLTMRATAAAAEIYLADPDERQKLRKHAHASESATRLRSIVELTISAAPELYISAGALDRDPWLLNVENGLLDLRTATLRPHDPAELCTKVAPVMFDLDAQHPALDALLDVLDRDGRAEYVRAIAGQALTGKQAKRFYLWTGPKGAVKSTTADALAAVLGPYAVAVEPSTLLVNKNGNAAGGARADLVAIRGARLAIAAELPENGRLDSAIVKRLTGGDLITARAPYSPEVLTFRPTHTLIMHANKDPKMDYDDDGMQHRVVPVPFTVRPETDDPGVRDALLNHPAARSAMLAWAVAGAVAWYANGLRDPEQPEMVKQRKREYIQEQDPFALWAEEALDPQRDPSAWTSNADITASYKQWCEANGERPHGKPGVWLRSNAEALGVSPAKFRGARGWAGLRLRAKSSL